MVSLRVTPEELRNVADEITAEVQSIKTCLRNINSEVTSTQSYWHGDASEKHISNYQEMKPNIDAIVGELETAPSDLLEIAGLYEETEEINVQLAFELPTDIF